MATKRTAEQLADVLFPEALEQDGFADGVFSIPPEQRKLHTETYDFTVETIVEKLNLITHDPQPASRADMASEGLPRLHAPIQPTCS